MKTMKRKAIKARFQRLEGKVDWIYLLVSLTNTVTLGTIARTIVLGDSITTKEIEELCSRQGIEVEVTIEPKST